MFSFDNAQYVQNLLNLFNNDGLLFHNDFRLLYNEENVVNKRRIQNFYY